MASEKRPTPAFSIRSAADLYQRKFGVLGLGVSGQAAAHLLLDHGARVLAADENPDLARSSGLKALGAKGAEIQLGPLEIDYFLGTEAIIVSPGAPHRLPVLEAARNQGLQVIGELELAARLIRTPMVAVTGTNGKTTTTELIAAMLSASGRRVVTGGNIGNPLTQCLEAARKAHWLVVEVSSFQLDTIQTFHPQIAVLLNIAQDHMDRYPDFDAYCASKARIFSNLGNGESAVVNGADPHVARVCRKRSLNLRVFGHGDEPNLIDEPLAARIEPKHITIGGPDQKVAVLNIERTALMGRHNTENIAAAALATLAAGGNLTGIRQALDHYPAPRHRMERVAEINEIVFINDSKATNPHAVQKALASFDRPVLLILGGRDKEMDFSPLKVPIQARVKTLLLMGEARDKLEKCLGNLVPTQSVATLEEALGIAWREARPGDVILLSPACASFDQYPNYQARGEAFRRAVETLQR
jgi:UDP-N-acetylmuramoylalanine--D-glutamate ligase